MFSITYIVLCNLTVTIYKEPTIYAANIKYFLNINMNQ